MIFLIESKCTRLTLFWGSEFRNSQIYRRGWNHRHHINCIFFTANSPKKKKILKKKKIVMFSNLWQMNTTTIIKSYIPIPPLRMHMSLPFNVLCGNILLYCLINTGNFCCIISGDVSLIITTVLSKGENKTEVANITSFSASFLRKLVNITTKSHTLL